MINSDIYNIIEEHSKQLGFVDFGIAKAEELVQERASYCNALENGYFANMEYLSRNIEKRFNPQLLVEGARSVLVFLAPYGDHSLQEGLQESSSGKVASYALGEDYHKVIKDKLFLLLHKITEIVPTIKGRVFTDSAPVMERAWGVRAGVGFIGKNNFLISRKVGIRTLIGVIIVDKELPVNPLVKEDMHPDKVNANSIEIHKNYCGSCTKCLDACPTGALCAPYTLDARKCISYHTIENNMLAQMVKNGEVLPRLYGRYFGCEACLDACPWNRKNTPGWPEFLTRRQVLREALPPWWEKLSGEEFMNIFATSPLLRSGLEHIQTAIRINSSEKNDNQ